MVIKQYAFNCDEKTIKNIDNIIEVSNLKYRDRSQFIILAIQKLIKEEQHN